MFLMVGFCEYRPKLKKNDELSVTGKDTRRRGENCVRPAASPMSSDDAICVAMNTASGSSTVLMVRLAGSVHSVVAHEGSAESVTVSAPPRPPLSSGLNVRTRPLCHAGGSQVTSAAVVPLGGAGASRKEKPGDPRRSKQEARGG